MFTQRKVLVAKTGAVRASRYRQQLPRYPILTGSEMSNEKVIEQQRTLREGIDQFRMLVDGVPDYALYLINPQGQVATWNSGAQRIKGYTAEEIIGKPFSTFFLPEDIATGMPNEILERARKEGRAEHEGWRVRKDGSKLWVHAVATALHDKSGKLVGFSKITRDVTEKMKQQAALHREIREKEEAQQRLGKSEESLRELSIRLLRTQDEERRRIGREMHDSLGQYLSGLKIKLEVLGVKYRSLDSEIGQELSNCSSILDECVKEVRTISYLLYPPMLEEMGLKSAISWYLDGFTQRSGIEVRFNEPNRFNRLPGDTELALFRVLQEALTNVHKHSESSIVDVYLRQKNGTTTLEVRDYGRGLPKEAPNQSGVGLRGMSERISQLRGTLVIATSEPGTLVRAAVPTQQEDRVEVNSADNPAQSLLEQLEVGGGSGDSNSTGR
jgi:PAS domain S-box-containing protein